MRRVPEGGPRRAGRAGAVGAVLATALALTACGGGSGGGGDESAEGPITWMATLHTPTTPEADGPIESALEEHTGEKLEVSWVPAASSAEKLNAALSTGKLADIVSMAPADSALVRQSLKSGMFWDVEDYLADFPNLAKIDEQTVASARIDGHLYGVPVQKNKARYGVLVRQDWLDNLGLEVPHTIEDLTTVAEAFAKDDPDGNGKDDTTGFLDREESFDLGFRSLSGYFGAGDDFTVDDAGQVHAVFASDEFTQAMEWYRGVYESGAVNQEFVTMQKTNQLDAIAQGKGGIVVTGLFEAKGYLATAQDSNPKTPMKWALVNDMTQGDVPRRILTDTGGGMGGWLAFPKEYVKSEAELKKVLGFVDKLLDEESFDLMTNGIEGTHYEVDGDGAVSITDQTLWEQEVQPYASSRPSEKVVTYKSSEPYVDEGNEKMAENEEYSVVNPTQSLTSETYDRQWTTLYGEAKDAYNQYVVGQIDMAEYEAIVDGLGGQGLDQILEEFTASYAEVNG